MAPLLRSFYRYGRHALRTTYRLNISSLFVLTIMIVIRACVKHFMIVLFVDGLATAKFFAKLPLHCFDSPDVLDELYDVELFLQ